MSACWGLPDGSSWNNGSTARYPDSARRFVRILPWENIQPIELSRGKVQLKREEDKLLAFAPEDLADHLERLSVKNLRRILDLLPNEYEAEVIQNLNVTRQRELLRSIQPKHAASILSLIDPHEAVDILLTLTEHRRTYHPAPYRRGPRADQLPPQPVYNGYRFAGYHEGFCRPRRNRRLGTQAHETRYHACHAAYLHFTSSTKNGNLSVCVISMNCSSRTATYRCINL